MSTASPAKTLVGLTRSISDLYESGDLPLEERAARASRMFLQLLDGKSENFPAVCIRPDTEPEDADYAFKNGYSWHNMETRVVGGFAEAFDLQLEDWRAGRPISRPEEEALGGEAYTADQTRRMITLSILSNLEYWTREQHENPIARMMHSHLNVFGGTSLSLPYFNISADVSDIASRPHLAEVFPEGVIDEELHRLFYKEDEAPTMPVAFGDGEGEDLSF